MANEKLNGDDYEDRGPAWGMAYQILSEGCEIPPSLKGFEHGLGVARKGRRTALSVQEYARAVSASYQRIR